MVEDFIERIWTSLGPGFSERVYHNALEVCLRTAGIPYETERVIPVTFEGHVLGNLRADLIVDRTTIVELKSVRALKEEHEVQVRLYLRLLGLQRGVLVNFPLTSTQRPEIIKICEES